MSNSQSISCYVPLEYAGQRLDQALTELLSDYSRARIQQWIKMGAIQVNGQIMRPRDRLLGGEHVHGYCPETIETPLTAQNMDLEICYEDESILIINKPPDKVVHPAAGNPDNTLVNGLLHYAPELEKLPRAGLVHRLDKNTSGLLVVARNLKAHNALIKQLQERTMGRYYQAIVQGVMVAGGTVDEPLGRHPVDRKRMAVVGNGKQALTHYRVLQRFRAHTHLSIRLETGRTHQIRVHMNHIHFPIVGDPVYGGRLRIPPGATDSLQKVLGQFRRQALHAATLSLIHPQNQQPMQWQSEPPADMMQLLMALQNDKTQHDIQDDA